MLAPAVSLQHLVPKPIGLGGTVALTVGQFSDYVAALGVPRDLMDYVMRAFKDALDREVRTVLNSTDLTNEFLLDLSMFTNRVINPMIRLTQELANGIVFRGISVDDFNKAELAIGKELAKLIRSTNYPYAEDLVYALSILIEHDHWVINNVARYGFNGLLSRINERALNEAGDTSVYLMATAFAWYSATAAVLGLIKEFRGVNRDALAQWSRAYAEELNAYIDTLDLLINDETYKTLKEEGVIT
ncbi:hypothetical protein [Vulcanisaeta sp. JCM 14467]